MGKVGLGEGAPLQTAPKDPRLRPKDLQRTSGSHGTPTQRRMLAPSKKLLEHLPAPFSPAATPGPPYRSGGWLAQRPGGRSALGEGSETDPEERRRLGPETWSGLPGPVRRHRRRGQGRLRPPRATAASALTSALPRSSRTAAPSMGVVGDETVSIQRSPFSAPPGPGPALRGGA